MNTFPARKQYYSVAELISASFLVLICPQVIDEYHGGDYTRPTDEFLTHFSEKLSIHDYFFS